MIGSTLNQRFRIDKELGQGGMGAVYRATDLVLGRTVAIKVLKEIGGEEVGRKIRLEAQILARLLHDNIVRLYDFGLNDGIYFLVMEEVDGASLFKRWRRVGLGDRLGILAQVAEALDYAHRQGIIHRDIKPGNVLLTSSDQAKLSDFGLSLLAEEAAETSTTRGTPHYMSPEQARGKKLDHRTDLYSLGVMLYECASGATPFAGSPMAVMGQHVHAVPDPPRSRNPELSEDLSRLIMALMAKSPDDRPATGAEVAMSLRELIVTGRFGSEPDAGVTTNVGVPNTVSGADRGAATPGSGDRSSAMRTPETPSTISPARTVAPRSIRASRSEAGRALAGNLVDRVESQPIRLTPDDRYLAGHYLAYFLGGSRRKGFLLRRPLDPLNADRGRLLLGMTALMMAGATDEAVAEAAELIESRFDVRPMLSPVVVARYLASRATPAQRKVFRTARQQLLEASPYAQERLVDERGLLNPGLMPQVLSDLRRVAPPRTEVDDELVARWNRVTDVWRSDPAFREAVLRYATTRAADDPASLDLWPEVVYPLIERARWQRRLRSGGEAFWDVLSQGLFLPDPGVKLDRAFEAKVPDQVVVELDEALDAFVFEDDPVLPGDATAAPVDMEDRISGVVQVSAMSLQDIGPVEDDDKVVARLTSADPIRLTHGELRELHREAVQAMQNRQNSTALRSVPIGPYRLVVVASIRGRSAGTVAIQGMKGNKQIELLVPSFVAGSGESRPVVAIWQYLNQSLAIAYLDFRGQERFILWDAVAGHQNNFDEAAGLNSAVFQLGFEAPDQLDRALSKRFRPRNPV